MRRWLRCYRWIGADLPAGSGVGVARETLHSSAAIDRFSAKRRRRFSSRRAASAFTSSGVWSFLRTRPRSPALVGARNKIVRRLAGRARIAFKPICRHHRPKLLPPAGAFASVLHRPCG